MKIAEALIERADIQKRIQQLSTRLSNNALVQEGEEPSEQPAQLLAELDGLMKRLCHLIASINLTNSVTVADGVTVTEMIAVRDCLSQKINIIRSFLFEASQSGMRARGSEIIVKSTVNVSALQKNLDELSKEFREIDTKIQSVNWTTELIEQ